MKLVIAIVLGLFFGCLQFFLLFKGVRSIAEGNLHVLYFVAQFFCPFVCLGLCVWLAKSWIALTATIICGILLLGAIVYKIYFQKHDRKKV